MQCYIWLRESTERISVAVSVHCTGHVAHRVPALPSHAAQIVPVQDHTDHSVLELFGDNVIQNNVQHCAHVHQECGEHGPGAKPAIFALPRQTEQQAHVERHEAHQHLDYERHDDPDRLLLHFGFELGGAAVDQIVHDDDVAADHYTDGNQEEEDDSRKVDSVVPA